MNNHYDWLDEHLPTFFKNVGVSFEKNAGIIVAHGDKCYQYRDRWEFEYIPFDHGVAIYLLSYVHPYADEVRETVDNTWVDPKEWVIANYQRFSRFLPPSY